MLIKSKRAISLALVLILTLTLMMLPFNGTGLAADTVSVDGRILSAGKAGDSSDWVEIAQNGGHSLILRKDVLPLGWVNFPATGTNNAYQVSNARNTVNNWFNNTLAGSARLRDFTVTSNVFNNLGNFASPAGGISTPTGTAARTGNDVAFLLSFGEAAQFCSLQHGINTVDVAQSSANARANYGKLTQLPTMPVQQDCWWLRSPGINTSSACSVGTHNSYILQTVWNSSTTSSPNSSYNYIRPALWVGSGIFDDTTTYTLTYNANGGVGAPAAQTGIPDNTNAVISSTAPTNGNRPFLGWALSSTATNPQYQPGGSILMTGNITLYASWGQDNATTYTLTYNANGGIGAPAPQTGIPANTSAVISNTAPTRDDHSFQGWALSSTATSPQYQPGGSILMTGNTTLYAVWTAYKQELVGVDGRILKPIQSGDLVNWVEIARYGSYSLIIRSSYLNIYNSAQRYGDPTWQYDNYVPTPYSGSSVRNAINNWFNGTAASAADKLPANARMRDYTMQNDALSKPGHASTQAGLTDGLSLPTNSYLRTGNDVAFAPSYGELANFCSKAYFIRSMNPNTQPSSSIAIANYNKITVPKINLYGVWTRSTGDVSGTMGALDSADGRVFQFWANNSAPGERGLDYPALWVHSSIFDECTLSYDANEGTGAPAAQTGIPSNTNATISSTIPTRTYYFFLGWALSPTATVPQYQPGGTILMTSSITLYAVWEVNPAYTRTLSYDANGGTGAPATQTGIVLDTYATISDTIPTFANNDFLGWDADPDATVPGYQPGDKILITGNITLYAVWKPSARTVTGLTWPMAEDSLNLGDDFLSKHDIVVELRTTFKTPAPASLSTVAVATGAGTIGRFTLENVPFGDYVLYIKRPGYLTRAMLISITASSPVVINLEPPGAADGGVFTLIEGDCDNNGRVDNSDLMMISELMGRTSFSPDYNPALDLNSDRRIDNEDILMVLNMWGKTIFSYAGSEGVDPFS
ncbi:MAG: InlB B-repeat-containing protein [Oscillospiraceae bacterium]|jgi:uncharacterized repeat protein (TIGR02543 family)|nr:InlB B-repeat-containing protein [Oscillospiraceae bacterium]